MELPARDAAAEDAFVAQARDLADPEPLVDVIEAAMAARRPRLAARLVGLIEDLVEIEPGSALERAQAAARLLLLEPDPQASWDELESAWRDVRRRRSWRIRRRLRQTLEGKTDRISRWSTRRRR